MIKLNARGEVADFQDASQFEPNKSEFECGEFAAAIVKFANTRCEWDGQPHWFPQL